MVERIVIARNQLRITTVGSGGNKVDGFPAEIIVPWSTTIKVSPAALETADGPDGAHNVSLIQSVVRAHTWLHSLREGTHQSVESLAEANCLHPKVVRQALRLAFLSPDVTSAILENRQPAGLSLAQIPKLLPLKWTEHRRLLG
jgi:hypothetical protein